MKNIELHDKSALSQPLLQSIVGLLSRIWPPKDVSQTLLQGMEAYAVPRSSDFDQVLLVWEGEQLVGHTNIFARQVRTGERRINNLALAGVCVHPGWRGRQLGKLLVQEAFRLVDDGRFECCLYQTQIPPFYEKLGACLIEHRFINSLSPENPDENPWWDPYVMVYPGDFALGQGVIDLNGPGY